MCSMLTVREVAELLHVRPLPDLRAGLQPPDPVHEDRAPATPLRPCRDPAVARGAHDPGAGAGERGAVIP